MLKNYFKLGFRNLIKNKIASLINILSLGLAVGCCLVVFEFIQWGTQLDNFHNKLNNLFVIERTTLHNGNEQLWGDSPAAMSPMLKGDFGQIKNYTRVNYQSAVIKKGEKTFGESITFADDAFYQMFDFPVKWGNKASFSDRNGTVLSEALSQKLFGDEDPIGRSINIQFDVNGKRVSQDFIVKGVFAKKPEEASWYFSAIIPYAKQAALGLDTPGKWSMKSSITFIEADNKDALKPIETGIKKYVNLYNEANPYDKIVGFNFQPLKGINYHALSVKNNKFIMTDSKAYVMFITIVVFMLLLVCFNYMNIAIASAFARLKEIGVRKVMGSNRYRIIIQFIVENLVLCSFSVILGLALAKFILMPAFSERINLKIGADMLTSYTTYVALAGLIILIAIGGASYPAFYISAFNPVNILKGSGKISNRNRFRKILLGFQFFMTFLTFSIAVAFLQENNKVKNKEWGYDPANIIVVQLDKSASYEAFKDELKNTHDVLSVSGSVQSLGEYSKEIVVKHEGIEQNATSIAVLPGLSKLLGIKIIAGRQLSEQYLTDRTQAVLVNQAFVHQMHWISAMGKNIIIQSKQYTVVGETNDFHYESFEIPVRPLVIIGCPPTDINYVYIKMSNNSLAEQRLTVQKAWRKVSPNSPYDFHYQSTVFDTYFTMFRYIAEMLSTSAMIMIIISMSGVFGLAMIVLTRKMKEISIRKVLGAGLKHISIIINREFLITFIVAAITAFPLAWMLMKNMLNLSAAESSVSFMPFYITFAGMLLLVVLSVSWHVYVAYTTKPRKFLRDE